MVQSVESRAPKDSSLTRVFVDS